MTDLSPYDATILATLAKVRGRNQADGSSETIDRLLNRLSDKGRRIGDAIIATDPAKCTPEANKTAEAIRRWAKTSGRKMSAATSAG